MKTKLFLLLTIGYLLLSANARATTPSPETTPSPAEEVTPVSDEDKAQQILEAVRERIKTKETEAIKRAFVGTLKSIANSTLVLETKNGIKQAEVSTEAAIIRVTKTSKKNIDFEDLAIGDLTVAMGYLGETEVLDAKRLIVSEVEEEEERKAICGTVEEIDLKKRTIAFKQLKTEQTFILEVAKGAEITGKDLDEIETNDRLIAAGTLEEENLLTTTRIHVVNGSEAPEPTPTEKSPTPTEE